MGFSNIIEISPKHVLFVFVRVRDGGGGREAGGTGRG